jgi:hypothetical protein
MRKIIGVCLLVLLLTNSAGAGIMPNELPAPPPPAPPTTPVEEPTDGGWMEGDASSLTQAALDIFAVLPSLL